jgi:tetratricopeptide (TPR) repeat protein
LVAIISTDVADRHIYPNGTAPEASEFTGKSFEVGVLSSYNKFKPGGGGYNRFNRGEAVVAPRLDFLRAKLLLAILGLCCLPWISISLASEWSDCSSGDPAKAIQGCSTILKNGSATPANERAVALVNRGIALYDRGDLDNARADYTAAIQLDPTNADAFHSRADLMLRQGKLEAAITDYSAAISLNGKFASAYNGRGNALRERGQMEDAIADYNKAIEFDPKSPFAYNGRANALRDKGQPEKAVRDYAQALALDPKYATAYIGRANAYSDQSNWPAALADYDAAIAIDPHDPMGFNNRGTAYQNKGELDKAIADYTQAITLDLAAFYFNRALAYHLKEDIDSAEADYSSAIKIDANYAFAYHNRGLIAQRKGELDRAISDFSKAIEINPQYPQNYSSRGLALLKKGDARKALADLQKSAQSDDRQPSLMVGLGEAYAKLQMYPEAKTSFDKAIQLNPLSSEAYLQRGRLMEAVGDNEKASMDYSTALSLDPDLKGAQKALKKTGERVKPAKVEPPPVGKPVVVSRFDTEASASRIRSVKILEDSADATASTPTADPAFKAVFLTPLGSMGRPVPIQMVGLTKPEEDLKKVDEVPTKETKQPEPASTSGALNSQEKAVAKPVVSSSPPSRPRPPGGKSEIKRQSLRSPEPRTVARPRVAGPERPRYGTAEIGAVRAFTRF